MNRERVKEIHDQALQVDPKKRREFLDRACGDDDALRAEVESLLDAYDRMGGFLEGSAPQRLEVIAPEHPTFEKGDRVGSYEVVRVLGAGGAGTVYEAIQARPQRRVALKVMHAGLGSESALRRFQDEAEILARLKHPGIATIYEAGVHETLPFFALEYVEGSETLLEHADKKNLGKRRRLDLFARVCDAIHHGHQKGIIHRDIKPGNVLVDASGLPKIIDFGIARAEGIVTEARELAGTLAYMSPDQCEPGDESIDVRSDVYSLGVVLYELLTGRLPYEVSGETITEATRRIREQPPAPLERRWKGDIEAIVRKALAKDREERYASAAALADDIRRHLTDRPVDAHPQSHIYQWRKFARRQRVAFASITGVVLVSIAAAVLGAWLANEREKERRAAEFQAYVANIAAASAALRDNDIGEARQRLDEAPERLRNWEWFHLHGRLDTSDRTISWPGHKIFTGAVSRDGVLVAATDRYAVRAWDLASGDVVFETRNRVRRFDSLALGPDHRRIALGSAGGTVEIHTIETAVRERVIAAHKDVVNSVVFDPGGERIATASSDGTAKVWVVETGRLVHALAGHEDRVIAVSFDSKGERIATGGRDGTVRIWEASTGDALRTLRGHEGSVEGVAWSPDGGRIASCSRDRTVRLWNASTGELTATRRGHTDNVRAIAFSSNGRAIATASYDRTVRLWGGREGEQIACHRGHASLVRAVAFLPGGDRVVTFSRDETLKLWNAAGREEVPTLRGHEDRVQAIAFSRDGTSLASASRDLTVRLWEPETRSEIANLLGHEGTVLGVAFVPDRAQLVSGSTDGVVRSWSIPDGRLVGTARGSRAYTVGFDFACRRAYFGTGSGSLDAVDLENGSSVGHWNLDDQPLSTLVVDSAGLKIATGWEDGTVSIWTAGAVKPLASAKLHAGRVHRLVYSPDGRLLASAAGDGIVKLLHEGTLETHKTLEGHTDSVLAIAFSPDQTRIATGSADGTIRLWDVDSGEQVAVLQGFHQTVNCLAFSPDGSRLASGEGGFEIPGVIRLWEAYSSSTAATSSHSR